MYNNKWFCGHLVVLNPAITVGNHMLELDHLNYKQNQIVSDLPPKKTATLLVVKPFSASKINESKCLATGYESFEVKSLITPTWLPF